MITQNQADAQIMSVKSGKLWPKLQVKSREVVSSENLTSLFTCLSMNLSTFT